MSKSPLVTYTRLSPNRSSPRKYSITRITPHCVVGQFTAKQILDMSHFVAYDGKDGSSCNYAIGKEGSIGLGVDEGDRSWCSSSSDNDNRAITIEVSSEETHPYAITEAAYNALIDLMTDICKRYGKTKLVWPGSKDATLSYKPKDNEMVLTAHRFFANKACPGDYMYSRFGQMAKEVTERLEDEDMDINKLTDEQVLELAARLDTVLGAKEPSPWSGEARTWAEVNGIISGDEKGQKKYKKWATREELTQIIYNVLKG
mgnify:CR=1 FL=1